jgi:hypothetical protein
MLISSEIEKELQRLQGAKMLLVVMAKKSGLVVPRACCSHRQDEACLACSAEWLLARIAAGKTGTQELSARRPERPSCRPRRIHASIACR